MKYQTFLLVAGAVTTCHCLFLAASLWLLNDKKSNRFLALILLFLGIRTGKSVLSLLFPGTDYLAAIAGLAAMEAAGPVLLMFVRNSFGDAGAANKRDFLHFTPLIALLPVLVFRNWSLVSIEYYLFTAQACVYGGLAMAYLWKNHTTYSTDDLTWRWCWMVAGCYSILCGSFVVQLFFYDPAGYLANVLVAALVVYGLSIYAIQKARLFNGGGRRRVVDGQEHSDVGDKIRELFERQELFLDPDLTVSKLATQIKLPPYLVSKIINQSFGCSFPEYVTMHRILKAEKLLIAKSQMLSIEGIAYECGYNSLSAFYAAFKKTHKITPAEFRNRRGAGHAMKIA